MPESGLNGETKQAENPGEVTTNLNLIIIQLCVSMCARGHPLKNKANIHIIQMNLMKLKH